MSETRQTIGRYTYVYRPLTASKALALLPLMSEAMDMSTLQESIEGGKDAASAIAANILKSMGTKPKRLARIAKLLAENCEVEMGDKQPNLGAIFELHFQGNLADLVTWLTMGVISNFGPFSATSSGDDETKAANPSKSPKR